MTGKGSLQGSLTQLIADLDGRTLPAWCRVQHYITGFHGLVHSVADGWHFIGQSHGFMDLTRHKGTVLFPALLVLQQDFQNKMADVRRPHLVS